jgi:hypothetical protein
MSDIDKFRFGVFEGDRFSNLWLAFTDGNEFYLGARSLMGRVKVSFHSSGICHVKVDRETRPRWKRPPTPDVGVLHAATVGFPGGYNKRFTPTSGTPKKKIFGIKAAPEGKMIEFGFFFTREPMDRTEQMLGQFAWPIVRLEMPDGEAVSVVARMTELNEESLAALRNLQIPIAITEVEQRQTSLIILWNDPSHDNTPLFLTSIPL